MNRFGGFINNELNIVRFYEYISDFGCDMLLYKGACHTIYIFQEDISVVYPIGSSRVPRKCYHETREGAVNSMRYMFILCLC